MKPSDLRNWSVKNKFSASHLNEIVNYIKGHGSIQGGRKFDGHGTATYSGSNGTVIGQATLEITEKTFVGRVVANGPSGTSDTDFSDNRYWVQGYYLNPTGDSTKPIDLQKDSSLFAMSTDPENDINSDADITFISIVAVTNLAEQDNMTHNLVVGTVVEVYEMRERDGCQHNPDAVSNNGDATGDESLIPQIRWVMYAVALGAPQYQFMVYQGVAQNKAGWDFVRAHAIFNP
jgi:hypothetical protein